MKRNSGNVLFFVLIGIALFAALSYALTNSGDSNRDSSEGNAKILAGELSQWFTHVQEHYNVARGIKGVDVDEIDMVTPSDGWITRCSDQDCQLYKHDGGPITEFYIKDPDFYKNGSGGCWGVPTYGEGPPDAAQLRVIRVLEMGDDSLGDVVISIQCVSDAVCEAFNKLNKLNLSGIPLDTLEYKEYNFLGYADPAFPEPDVTANSDIGDEVAELAGKRSFCIANGLFGGARNEVIHVLDPR